MYRKLIPVTAAALLMATVQLHSQTVPEKAAIHQNYHQGNFFRDSQKYTIDPIARALDFQQAFKSMIEQDPEAKIYVKVNGITINRVVGFEIMENKTVILLKLKSPKRDRTRVIRVEDIEQIGQW
jgi:hypothetical protein